MADEVMSNATRVLVALSAIAVALIVIWLIGSDADGSVIPAQSVVPTAAPASSTSTTTTVDAALPCDGSTNVLTLDVDDVPVTGEARAALSAEVFPCADSVVLLDEGRRSLTIEAVEDALARSVPLLTYEGDFIAPAVNEELLRLAPEQILVYGEAVPLGLDGVAEVDLVTEPIRRSPGNLWSAASELQLGAAATRTLVVPIDSHAGSFASIPLAVASGTRVYALDVASRAQLRRFGEAVAEDELTVGDLELAPAFDDTAVWQIRLAAEGAGAVPGGGADFFPDRRIIAFYGSPVTPRLGVLGEQDAEATIDRLAPIIEGYAVDGAEMLTGFEIIATVADGVAGRDGDYSNELSADVIRPWVELAEERGVFVLIDLQPGRADFLSQAKEYEEFLRLPHVGLALDPEWRIGPNEQPLQRIGSVSAAEVNEVVEWLAEIVRDETLPQKPLVIHQFLRRMVTNRDQIETPPELAVVIHVDGQGGLGAKHNTYRSITTDDIGPNQTLYWGWKNFYDEDPRLATPDEVNAVEPAPVMVSFQ